MLEQHELYRQMIIDHGRHPRNYGPTEAATHQHVGHNPLCGDDVVIYLKIDAGIITAASFEGTGCAISTASASLLTEAIRDLPVDQVYPLFEQFHAQILGEDCECHLLGKLAVFAGVAQYPMRVKCASLAWHTLIAALERQESPVTTEEEST